MTSELSRAVPRIAEVIMFEHWLRFYFIAEENDKLFLRLPEKAMEQLRQRYSAFHDLALHLNGQEITHETSMKEVCLFISGDFGGQPVPESLVTKVFDSPDFHLEMQLFSYWVQAHESQLDAGFMEFSEWLKQFRQWKESDEVRAHIESLRADMALAEAQAPETTQ